MNELNITMRIICEKKLKLDTSKGELDLLGIMELELEQMQDSNIGQYLVSREIFMPVLGNDEQIEEDNLEELKEDDFEVITG